MARVENSIEVNAPIEHVFQVLTDPRRGPEWNPNIVDVSDVTLPMGEGVTWKQTVMMAGRPMRVMSRVSRFEPPHLGELEITGDQNARVWTRCEELDGRTRVTQGMDFEPPGGLLGGLIGGVARTMVERELSQTMERQRELLEREAKR